ncbi:MAG: GntR family transcriptional regulator [Spirochaetales bacterium]|nr:GntR family transcriptional regulator [Spirochaetales bacterium]MBR1583635.1 GntR family transcriptional regulator [Spirochaetales bacterium]
MIPYTKIEATPLNERISTLLKDAIIEGQFRAGEEISLTAIAERYGVSRTPVREAFQHLAKDGFLTLRMNKSAIVVAIDERFFRNHYEIRSVLEAQAAYGAAASNADKSELLRIQELGEKTKLPMTLDDFRSYNMMFHRCIWRLCENERLQQLLSDMWVSSYSSSALPEIHRQSRTLNSHRRLVNDIINHDCDAAFEHMKRHIIGSLNNILKILDEGKKEA